MPAVAHRIIVCQIANRRADCQRPVRFFGGEVRRGDNRVGRDEKGPCPAKAAFALRWRGWQFILERINCCVVGPHPMNAQGTRRNDLATPVGLFVVLGFLPRRRQTGLAAWFSAG